MEKLKDKEVPRLIDDKKVMRMVENLLLTPNSALSILEARQ